MEVTFRMSRTRVALAVVALALVAALGGATVAVSADDAPVPQAGRVGESATESNYVSIDPCRLADSRVGGPQVAAGSVRQYTATGNLSGQGGPAGGCGVPAAATALNVSITAVDAQNNGNLRVWPADTGEITTTFLNYDEEVDSTNAGTIDIASGTGTRFRIRANVSATHVVVDVLGYFVDGLHAFIGSNGTTIFHTSGATDSTKNSTGVYTITFDRNVFNCTYAVTALGVGQIGAAEQVPANHNQVKVRMATNAGAVVDTPFFVTVTC